jgi:hypothetical protein
MGHHFRRTNADRGCLLSRNGDSVKPRRPWRALAGLSISLGVALFALEPAWGRSPDVAVHLGGQSGRIRASGLTAPSNDAFLDARPLSGQYGSLSGVSPVGAISELGEVHYGRLCGSDFPCPSLWFSWSAPDSGRLAISATQFGRMDLPLLLLYRGTRLHALVEEDVSLARSWPDRVTVTSIVDAGASYRIAVLGTSTGFRLSWDLKPDPCTITGSNGPDLIRGTRGADYICGLGGDDVIDARAGNDTVDGGSGHNTITFAKAPNPVHVGIGLYAFEQQDAAFNGVGSPAEGWGHDSLHKVQNAIGSSFDDILVGGGASVSVSSYRSENVFMGGHGDDVVDAGWASDRLFGGAGDDILYPGRTTDLSPDQLIDGGPGSDRVSYGHSRFTIGSLLVRQLEVDLGSGVATMCCSRTDRLIDIENARGSASRDVLSGDRNANVLWGGPGGGRTLRRRRPRRPVR